MRAFLAALAVACLLGARPVLAGDSTGASSLAGSSPAGPPPATANGQSGTTFECPGCLSVVPADADRCPVCGLSFKKLEYVCPRCGATVAFDAKKCDHCGLVFDAPLAGAVEKRSVADTQMPPVRDFQTNPAPAETGLAVHGSSLTEYRVGKEMGIDHPGNIQRVVEELNLNIMRIGLDGLSFHLNALGEYDSAPRQMEPLKSIQLHEAYLEYDSPDNSTIVKLGRQYVDSGVVREFVDAIFVHQMIGDRLGLEATAGHPATADGASPTGDLMAAGRVFWRGVPTFADHFLRDLTVSVSAVEERWDWTPVKRQVGFDVSFSPNWDYDVSGHLYADLLSGAIYDARFTFVARPSTLLQITADYRYLIPSDMLPQNSIFTVFSDTERHEFELDADLKASERLKITFTVGLIHIPQQPYQTSVTNTTIELTDDNPYEVTAGLTYKHGETIKGEFGAFVSGLIKGGMEKAQGATVYESSILEFRLYEKLSHEFSAKSKLNGSVDVIVDLYDSQVYTTRNYSVTLTGTVGYSYGMFAFTVGGDVKTTPDMRDGADGFAKVGVNF